MRREFALREGEITLRKSFVWTIRCGVILWILFFAAGETIASAQSDPAVEERVVEYLKEQIKIGKPIIVTELLNKVFTGNDEKKVLDRLFNVFFNIPIFIVQYKSATDRIPTLADIASQFNLQIPGEVEVLLTIMENDPRIPDFIKRNPQSGEIVSVDIEAIKRDKRFSQEIERTLAGWLGRSAPAFELNLSGGGKISSAGLEGKNYLIYFWYSACPPCVRTSPHLVELYEKFKGRNFTIVAVNADRLLETGTTDEQRAAYIRKEGIHFPVAHLNKKMQEDYGNINVYPTFFLVDSHGVICKHHIGYQPPHVLTEDVEELLGNR